MDKNFFIKSHGIGNEYIVLDEKSLTFPLTPKAIQRICNIHYGIGSDGIVLYVASQQADLGVRIFNPDGSEAEKSGNALRIFAKYAYDYGLVSKPQFTVETLGGIADISIIETANGKATSIQVGIGQAIFDPLKIPLDPSHLTEGSQRLHIKDQSFEINCVSVGNPHCVILKDQLNVDEIKTYGPEIEKHPLFPNRINVQFVKVTSDRTADILIWERGAGFTLASGSSSSAVAAILKKKQLINNHVTINMIGGKLMIDVDDNWYITLTGDVRQIAEGTLHPELMADLETPLLTVCYVCICC